MRSHELTATRSRSARHAELKRMLDERRRELLSQVYEKIRNVRTEGMAGNLSEVFDAGESSGSDIQDDIGFALIQLKGETLSKIDEALSRLDEGEYGHCYECGDEISAQRLKALPFAVRCRDCEEQQEVTASRERLTQRSAPSRFLDVPM